MLNAILILLSLIFVFLIYIAYKMFSINCNTTNTKVEQKPIEKPIKVTIEFVDLKKESK